MRRSPVLSSRWWLDLVLLLLLRLDVALLTCRAAEQLLGLLLAQSALWLRRLAVRRFVGCSAATTATAPTAAATTLLLTKRELVVPFCVEVVGVQENRTLVDR